MSVITVLERNANNEIGQKQTSGLNTAWIPKVFLYLDSWWINENPS